MDSSDSVLCVSTHRPGAFTGVGGGPLDFMFRLRVVAVQGVGIGRNGVVAFGAYGGHGHTWVNEKMARQQTKRGRVRKDILEVVRGERERERSSGYKSLLS